MMDVVSPRALTYRVPCQEWFTQGVRASRYFANNLGTHLKCRACLALRFIADVGPHDAEALSISVVLTVEQTAGAYNDNETSQSHRPPYTMPLVAACSLSV